MIKYSSNSSLIIANCQTVRSYLLFIRSTVRLDSEKMVLKISVSSTPLLSLCTSAHSLKNSRTVPLFMRESQSRTGRDWKTHESRNPAIINCNNIRLDILHWIFQNIPNSVESSWFSKLDRQCEIQLNKVFMDASTVGKRPTEIVWLWSPDLQLGGWAPPQVPLSDSDSSQPVNNFNTVNFKI